MPDASATVFVADDNQQILQGLDRALTANRYRVRTAISGRAVLDLLAAAPEPPDLVLLDVMMPEMSGIDVLAVLRRDARWMEIPVVLITATHDEALPINALRGGAVDFLTKPFRLDELIARVDSHVRRGRALRRARDQSRLRMQAIDVIREMNRVVAAPELFSLVTARTGEILDFAGVALVVAGPDGAGVRALSASFEATAASAAALAASAEVRALVEAGQPAALRGRAAAALLPPSWRGAPDTEVDEPCLVVVPSPPAPGSAAFAGDSLLGPERGEAAELAGRVVEAVVQACGRIHAFQSLLDQRQQLHDLAHTDELTGVATRRHILAHLEHAMAAARERGEPLSLAVLDLDNLKVVNDTHGHLAGDAVLRALGGWLRSEGALRAGDRAGRYGGDEFVVVLPGTDAAGAARFGERARAYLAGGPVAAAGGASVRTSLSVGVASWPGCGATVAEEMIARADAAMYRAKQAGGDRVCVDGTAPVAVP